MSNLRKRKKENIIKTYINVEKIKQGEWRNFEKIEKKKIETISDKTHIHI